MKPLATFSGILNPQESCPSNGAKASSLYLDVPGERGGQ